MGSNKITAVDMSEDNIKTNAEKEAEEVIKKAEKKLNARSKMYVYMRSQVDKTKKYDVTTAIELVNKLSRKGHNTITADINVKEQGINLEMTLPHSTGKTVKVAIADEALLEKLDAGEIDFDVLIAEPKMMSKIAKYARILGPQGLMPNPKNKTVTEDTAKRKKELEAGVLQVRTEKKAPLLHVQIGQTKDDALKVVENLKALSQKIGLTKIKKITVSSTMSPGVKVDLETLKKEE